MTDRLAANPNRYLITPEDGSPPFYSTLTRADNPINEGTLLDKAALLKDATAALYSLTSAAVPDDVLKKARELITAAQNAANSAASTANQVYSRARIETGSYTGTGSGTTGDAKTINFTIPWKFFFNLIIPAYIDSAYASGGLYVCSYDGSRIVNLTNNGQLYEFTKTSYSITVPKYMNNTTNYYYYMAIA